MKNDLHIPYFSCCCCLLWWWWWWWRWWWFINSASSSRKNMRKRKKEMKRKNENEKENEKCYYFVLAFFDENVTLSLEGFCEWAGLEITESAFACGGGGSSIQRPSSSKNMWKRKRKWKMKMENEKWKMILFCLSILRWLSIQCLFRSKRNGWKKKRKLKKENAEARNQFEKWTYRSAVG